MSTHHIGTYEAKTHLPQLLRRLQQGDDFIITHHGKPAGRLIPAEVESRGTPSLTETIAAFKAFSRKSSRRLSKRDWKAFKNEGRAK